MKQIIILLAVIIFLSCKEDSTKKDKLQKESTVLDSLKIAKTNEQNEQVSYNKEKNFIKSFYKNYIREIEGLDIDENKIQFVLDKYCSSELVQNIKSEEELDYDPFIDAQDVPPKFLQSLEINKVKGKENRFVASYLLGEIRNNIELELIKEENQLKINKVYTINIISAFDNTVD